MPSRWALANDPTAPRLEPQDRGSGVSNVAHRAAPGSSGGRPDDSGFADQEPRQVVQVGRLLDDLAAALVDPAPPGGRRGLGEPPGHDEARRPVRETTPQVPDEVQRSQVVTDRDDQAGPLDGRGKADRPVRIVGGQGLFGQERDPEPDQSLADAHRLIRRHARVRHVRTGGPQHLVEVIERPATPGVRSALPRLPWSGS